MTDEETFDLAAAGLRADGTDLRISVEVLASKLESSLPGRCRVERHGGGLLGRGDKRVRHVAIDLGGSTYELRVAGERVEGSRERQVGGISIKRETLTPDQWVAALTAELQTEARRSARRAPRWRGCSADMTEPPQDSQQEREQAESLARIEAGHIPLSAERRLSELGRHGGGSFTSDLSVNGFALCHQLGLTPLSQVMGSSIYQMGYQSSWGTLGYGGAALVELDSLSEALNEVRGRALDRLAEEARHVGADAVVGVETRAGESELAGGAGGGQLALEHMVLGTAVRRADSHGEQPVLTELSIADYALLLRAGIEPAGIVAWSAVFFASYAYSGLLVGPGSGMGVGIGSVQNFELREFTQAFYGAREAVMGQITRQAASLGASGVVGVRIAHTARPHTLSGGMGGAVGGFGGREVRGLMVTFNAIGTAIHQHSHAAVQAPEPVLDLFA